MLKILNTYSVIAKYTPKNIVENIMFIYEIKSLFNVQRLLLGHWQSFIALRLSPHKGVQVVAKHYSLTS